MSSKDPLPPGPDGEITALISDIEQWQDAVHDRSLASRVFIRPLSWDKFKTFHQIIDETAPSLRISYFDGQISIKFTSAVHEVAHLELMGNIRSTLLAMNPAGDIELCGLGHTTHTDDGANVSLEGDSVYAPDLAPHINVPVSTFVVECTNADSYPLLLRKADMWFKTVQSIAAVVIINFHDDASRTVDFEVWERSVDAAGRTLQARQSFTETSDLSSLVFAWSWLYPAGRPAWAPVAGPTFKIPEGRVDTWRRKLYRHM